MTEDLWYHALKFLDKYRTDVDNYDIEELYEFADATGILERHKALLSQPFNESQVDMKIMYYELIKMLIDYERRNHPETYDATKTVGKIEGYQELTNKLQRYLNQRFILDIDDLGKKQQSLTNMFSTNSEVLLKIETLEQNFASLAEQNQTLLVHVEKVEEANKTLSEEIRALQYKDLNEITASFAEFQSKHEQEVDLVKEEVGLVKVTQAELNSSLANVSKEAAEDRQLVDERLSNLSQETEKMEEKVKSGLKVLSEDVEKFNLVKDDLEKRLEIDEDRIVALENSGPAMTKNLVGQLEERMTELQGNTNNTLKTLEERMNIADVEINDVKEEQRLDKAEVGKMTLIQDGIASQLAELDRNTKESWRSVEDGLAGRNQELQELAVKLEGHGGRLNQLETDCQGLASQVETAQRSAEAAGQGNAELVARVNGQADAVESVESELETAKDRLRKNVEAVEGINKSIMVFESRHVETVERMKEVTVLASSVETYVKSQEQSREQDTARHMATYSNQLEEVRSEVAGALGRLSRVDEDNQTLLEKINNLSSRLVALDSKDGELEVRIGQATAELMGRLSVLDNEGGAVREKVQQLEDAHTLQVEKVNYVEALGSRVNMIEASRQQSEARVREEVDASLGQKMGAIDQIRADLETLEDQLQRTKEFFVEANRKSFEVIKEEQEVKDKDLDEKLKKEKADLEVAQSALSMELETLNKKVANLGKEKDKLKAEMEKTAKVSFTTINEMKADISAENRSEVESLKNEVKESIKDNEEKVIEAEAHVNNLRELNQKLLEQVKAQMADHGQAQEVMVEGLRTSNQQFLVAFQQQVEKEVELLAGKVSQNTEEMKKKGAELVEVVSKLEEVSRGTGELGKQVINLEARETAVEVEASKAAEDAKESANQIFELSQTIASLDGRHIETVERMKEVAVMVNQFENQTKEIGQAFKEDQRKELKSIESQLNTIYTEYERMEKELADMRKESNEADMKKTVEELMERQKAAEDLGAQQGEGLARAEDKIGKFIETANTLMVGDATKTEKLNGLEKAVGGLEDRFSGLESADLFLQEAQKQLMERTTTVEGQGKKIEESLSAKVEEQQKEAEEKLKVQVASLLKDVGELYTGQETLGGHIDKIQEDEATRLTRLEVLESGVQELKSQVVEMEERVKSLEEETKSIHGGLVSLQFQAEKEEAVKTLASRMDRIDAERQQSEARATEQQQRLVEENSERLEELQRRVAQLESMERKVTLMEGKILEVGQQSKGDWEAMEAQLKVLQREAEEQGRQMAAVEPRAAELEQKVEEMQNKIQEKITLLVSRSEEHSTLIERSSTSVAMFSEKITSYEKEVKEVANSGTHDLDSFKQEVERKILELFDTTEDQANQIESLNSNLSSVNDQSNRTLEDVVVTQSELAGMKKIVSDDHELIVRRVADQKEAADLELASIAARFERLEANAEQELREVQQAIQRAESASDQCTSLEVRCGHMEVSTREQSSLVLAVEKTLTDRLEEIHELVKENYSSNTGELRSLRGEVAAGTENMWTLVVEVYSALRGSTLVLKSEGVVKEHQADVLGVYRMIDSYNDRPVYKQDGGENYIYYSAASSSWLVGAVVGHQYGWLRNTTAEAGSSRWVPDLTSGWEYRPLVRSGGLDSLQSASWKSDDGSLRIEPLRDVEKVNELIRDIKNSRKVD